MTPCTHFSERQSFVPERKIASGDKLGTADLVGVVWTLRVIARQDLPGAEFAGVHMMSLCWERHQNVYKERPLVLNLNTPPLLRKTAGTDDDAADVMVYE